MELFVYRGDWGLPTIDYECAKVLSYIKFTNAKVILNFNGNPFSSPNGMLPYLVTDTGKKIAGYNGIIEFLQTQGYNANAHLVNQNATSLNAPIQYIFEKLFPFFMYNLWGDPSNLETTRAVYAKRIPIPFNFYYPRKYIAKTDEITETFAQFNIEDSIELHTTDEMMQNAKKCINWIAEKLGDKKYFYGDAPAEIDAVLYGYLSVILKLTVPNNVLQNHLRQCTNLVSLVERITICYFTKEASGLNSPSSNSSSSSSSSSNSKSKKQEAEQTFYDGTQKDEDTPGDRKKRYIVSGIVASVAMVGYAILSGLLSISHHDRGGGFISYDDPDYDDED